MFKKTLIVALLFLHCVTAISHDFEVDGIYYEYTTDGVYVTYAGDSFSAVSDEYSGDIIIPSTVTYYGNESKVVSIGANAFRECKGITSIIIGDNVTEIFHDAFKGCDNLQRVLIGKSLYSTHDAFYYCNAITTVHYNCVYVSKCAINNSSVMEITLGENVKELSDFVGTGWYKKQPEGLLYLDNWLVGYKGEEPVGDITIAEGTTHINEYALSYCNSITSVTIPQSVIYIGDFFLRNCESITGLKNDVDKTTFDSRENCNAIIETNTNTIIKACNNTNIPTTIESLGLCSFEGLDFVEIDIPDNVVDIQEGAFQYCEKLKRITIGNGVTSIENGAFCGCSALEELYLGNNLQIIGEGAFRYCSSLADVQLPNSIIRIKKDAFSGTKWHKNQQEYPYILDGWILYDVGAPYLKEGIRGIADRVYSGHETDYIGTLRIPNTVVGIGEFAFSSCRGLYGVVIPNSVRYIGIGAFYYTNISHVSIPQGIERISSSTFFYCRNLRKVVIPSSVIEIERDAFGMSDNIEEIYVLTTRPPKIENSFSIYSGIYNNATIFVPKGAKDAYLQDSEWSKFVNIEEIETEYEITYVIDDEIVSSSVLTIGSIIEPVKDVPIKEGFSFRWENLPETMPAKDITVYGLYTPKTYYIRYEIDNQLYRNVGVEYGDSIRLIDTPVKEGHTFSGWSDVPVTMPANDVIVKGSFYVNTYAITYIVDGEIYKADSITYGANLIAVEEPVKEGHTFSGWSEIPETMPANDVIIKGTFSVNKYLVTFKIGDEIIVSDSLEYGSSIVVPEAPEREGYTFNGWGEVAETVPANDLIYEGEYTANTYNVYYYVGDKLVHTDVVAYGESIPEYIYEDTGEGESFLGWIGDTYETMPAHDVIYVANIETGIEHLTINKIQWGIYDIAGRKITNIKDMKKGVYIVNGKKLRIK